MAKLIVFSLFSILLLINVNNCRGSQSSSQPCQESEYPVCATNGTHWYFFKNICVLKDENKDRVECGLPKLNTTILSNCFKECDQMCTDEYAPICAKTDKNDQKTFSNRCEFDLENCRFRNIWKILHEGECPKANPINNQPNVLPKPQAHSSSTLHHPTPLKNPHENQPQSNMNPTSQSHVKPNLHPHANPLPYSQGKPHLGPNEQIYPLPHVLPVPIQAPNSQPSLSPQFQPLLLDQAPPIPGQNVNQFPQSHVQPQPHPHPNPHPYPHGKPHLGPNEQIYPQPQHVWPLPQQNIYPIQHPNIQPRPNPQSQQQLQPPLKPLRISGPNEALYPQPQMQPDLEQNGHPIHLPIIQLLPHPLSQKQQPLTETPRILGPNEEIHPQPQVQPASEQNGYPIQVPNIQPNSKNQSPEQQQPPLKPLRISGPNEAIYPQPKVHPVIEQNEYPIQFPNIQPRPNPQSQEQQPTAETLQVSGPNEEIYPQPLEQNGYPILPIIQLLPPQSQEQPLAQTTHISGPNEQIHQKPEVHPISEQDENPAEGPHSQPGPNPQTQQQAQLPVQTPQIPPQNVNPTPQSHVQPQPHPNPPQYPLGNAHLDPNEQINPQTQFQTLPEQNEYTIQLTNNQPHPQSQFQQQPQSIAQSIPILSYKDNQVPQPHIHHHRHHHYQPHGPHHQTQSPSSLINAQQLPHSQTSQNHHSHSCLHQNSDFKPLPHCFEQHLPLSQPSNNLIPQPQVQTSPNPDVQVQTLPQPLDQPPHLLIPHPINRRCPTHCSLDYDPVCATFGGVEQTFDNQCFMRADICGSRRAWVLKHTGECIEPESEHCNHNCPKIYSPMCATFNGQNKTFNNECLLDEEICVTSNPWDILYHGECRNTNQNCPTICPNVYIPVCASYNGIQKEFPNQCFVLIETCRLKEDWKILHQGRCEQVQLAHQNCPDVCPAIYAPVCAAFDGSMRTFSNGCELNIEKCKTGKAWTILGSGPCETQMPPNVQTSNTFPPFMHPTFNRLPIVLPPILQTPSKQPTFDQLPIVLPPNSQPPSEQQTPSNNVSLACPICSDSYKPVCGFLNGQQQTFNNECLLLSENCYSNTQKWVVGHEGKCHAVETPRNCPNICPLNYDPVCASFNGIRRTFPNECELNHEAYKTNNQWVIINLGECDYCPVCSDDIAPVCAELRGETRTFDNVCKVEAENCRTNSGWKIVSKTSCEIRNCPAYCPRIYIPICAISNGEARTFGNICEMKKEACNTNTAWNIASKGECPGPNEKCPQSCSLEFNPICAVYEGVSREFINECFLRSEICKTHKNWEFVNAGPCSDHEPNQAQDQKTETLDTTTMATLPEPESNCQINKCLNFRDPVCAILNGEQKTFTNSCFLHNLKCKTGQDWKIIRRGSCRRTSTPAITTTTPQTDML